MACREKLEDSLVGFFERLRETDYKMIRAAGRRVPRMFVAGDDVGLCEKLAAGDP